MSHPGSYFRPGGPHLGRVAGREGDRRRERDPLRARRDLKQVRTRRQGRFALLLPLLLSIPGENSTVVTCCRAFVENIDEFLYRRGAIDAALLFETESELDQVCCYSDVLLYDRCIMILPLTQRASITSLATTACASSCSACRRRTPTRGWRT